MNDQSQNPSDAMPAASAGAQPIVVTFAYERALWRRGMTGWWRSVVPPEPFVKRAIFWALVWFLVLAVALTVSAFGLSTWLVGAGLIGAAVMVATFTYLQRTRMSRFWDVIGTHWDRAGETCIEFSADGMDISDAVSDRQLSWAAVDAIKAVRGGTVFRSGIAMIIVPDKSLPEGMGPKDFRATLQGWRRS